jgi:uncharacterized Tic20 family protein
MTDTNAATESTSSSLPYSALPGPGSIPISQMTNDDQRTWGAFVHFIGLVCGFAGAWFMYLLLRNRGDLVRAHTATELNIALTYLLGLLVAAPLALIPIVGILVFLTVAAGTIARFIFVIISAQRAYQGHPYQVPGAIRFVK